MSVPDAFATGLAALASRIGVFASGFAGPVTYLEGVRKGYCHGVFDLVHYCASPVAGTPDSDVPANGRHGGSYYKISTSTRGKIKVVDRKTYKPTPGEKATIIYADTEASGWLLRAAAANAAAQRAGREDE